MLGFELKTLHRPKLGIRNQHIETKGTGKCLHLRPSKFRSLPKDDIQGRIYTRICTTKATAQNKFPRKCHKPTLATGLGTGTCKMVKAYQRYSLAGQRKGTLGVIVSTACKDVAWADESGNLILAPALDSLNLWNLRTGALMVSMRPENARAEITSMGCSENGSLIAAGYFDGTVRIWDRKLFSLQVTLEGHKSGVSSVVFHSDGTIMASGSLDTDIIIWDVVGESGKFRLRGHKDGVTCLHFLSVETCKNGLLSASKDGLIKIWDLSQQHCIQTLTGHRSAIWCLAVNTFSNRLVTGGADDELRLWSFEESAAVTDSKVDIQIASYIGCIAKGSQSRAVTLQFFGGEGSFLMCQTADKKVELYRVRGRDEALKKMRRRVKRAREKALLHKEDGSDGETPDADAAHASEKPSAADELERIAIVAASAKIRGAAVLLPKQGKGPKEVKMMCALVNNSVEVYSVPLTKSLETSKVATLHMQAHHSDVRAVAFSSDDVMLASCAGGEVKLWNVASGLCIRSVESGYGVCVAFAPGDKYVMVGTKAGRLQLFDVSSSDMVEDIEAHEGSLWSLALKPDGRGVVTAGADKQVKFWDFSATRDENGHVRLSLAASKEATMEDDILSVGISSNGKLLALALLDCTVKIFAMDSLKFFLSLYGHRLPVLSLDISSDSSLIVTGSADKNVKIWGLDFGDCHKSMFAHGDSVMAVRFVPRTHYFFSAGKDRTVKMWDADKFQLITTVGSHYAEVWCLAVSGSGDVVASGSHDRSVRLWLRTEEQVFLEEERAKEREATWDAEDAGEPSAAAANLEAIAGSESAPAASARSLAAMDAADRIVETLRLCADPPGTADAGGGHALLLGLTPNGYFRRVVGQIKAAEMDAALATLPFDAVVDLIVRVAAVLEDSRRSGGAGELEPLCRAVGVLVRLHHTRLAVTAAAEPALRALRAAAKDSLRRRADLLGYNLAALRSLRRRLPSEDDVIPAAPTPK